MALRFAEVFYLEERTGEMPLLLLDDVFDNLDPSRINTFLELLRSGAVGQSIVTAARPDIFDSMESPDVHSIRLERTLDSTNS
jgi:DNA replication and repair protein RecF